MEDRLGEVSELERKLAAELNSRFQDDESISSTSLQLCKALNGIGLTCFES
jgi:hypothetical protein